jgi:CIC family chloride channel protein
VPAVAPAPQVYAVAGMATVFAAAAQAPFVAMTILLEITGDYRLTVLVMAAAAVSYFVYAHYQPDSMYTVRLTRRGIRILRGNDVRPIGAVAVAGAMEPAAGPVPWSTSVQEAYRTLTTEHRPALIVTGSEDEPEGGGVALVGLADLTRPVAEERWQAPVGRYATAPPAFLRTQDSVDEAMRAMALNGTELMPVVGAAGSVAGIVTAQGLMRLYHRSTPAALLASRERGRDSGGDPGAFVTVRLAPHAAAVGRWCLSHKESLGAGWKLDTVLKAVGAETSGPAGRQRRLDIRREADGLRACGLVVQNDRIYTEGVVPMPTSVVPTPTKTNSVVCTPTSVVPTPTKRGSL